MPKDEFDFEDPFELNGMAFLTNEDTTLAMAECFAEEYLRLGYTHKQILSLFQNPHYLGPNLAFQARGEPAIRDLIAEVFARWGRAVNWAKSVPDTVPQTVVPAPHDASATDYADHVPELTDPLGSPIPKLNV